MPLTSEALRERVLDASARLRDSFIRYDAKLTGSVAAWQAASCIRAAGLDKTLNVAAQGSHTPCPRTPHCALMCTLFSRRESNAKPAMLVSTEAMVSSRTEVVTPP